MEKRYLVGEVSAITGISKDTLRFYDKTGLFKPSYVDQKNKYRYYSYDQFWQLDIITCCRNLHMPLESIRVILDSENNENVLNQLLMQQQEAIRLSQYYSRIASDIDWYRFQAQRIQNVKGQGQVYVKDFPERTVLYGKNTEDMRAYHLKLQEACVASLGPNRSVRRSYGFLLDLPAMAEQHFVKQGEFVSFDWALEQDIAAEYKLTIPKGTYACTPVYVKNNHADFSGLLGWLRQHHIEPQYSIADEVGLQLFDYLEHGYWCEVKVLIS